MEGYYNLNVEEKVRQYAGNEKQPFPHQQEAFSALTKTFTLPIDGYKGSMLVLPTGAGKTFTSVNWICRHILPAGIKVLWLAQTGYLLDQAAGAFKDEIYAAHGRQIVNMRVVSSNESHANAGTISLSDDILICTIQTAISAYNAVPLDGQGNVAKTPFRQFIENCQNSQLFVVVDEAHHTPAYGCRKLLWESFREDIKNLYILGLTATPTYMDKRFSGWLNVIFDKGICYEAKKEALQQQSILSVPEYKEKPTEMEFEVDDDLYDRLVYKHKDLPENIIEYLAHNQGRNNLIVDDYLKNASEYGKTIIFADRWFQCEYILEKLKENGVQAGAVYSSVSLKIELSPEGMGRSHNNAYNDKVMRDFRAGKYDVVVNVKMLTEGVDVPDVKTVMITRQTTSNILLTQMVGRALRGPKAGGGPDKANANIVFFYDKWKRLLNWAKPGTDIENGKPATTPRPPLELVSIYLVKLAAGDIEFTGFEDAPYLTFIPVGFYGCEYTVSIGDNEEMAPFAENVVVYEFNKNKYSQMIDYLKQQDLTGYADEKLMDGDFEDFAGQMIEKYFGDEKDDFDNALTGNITKIVRHMAQNATSPEYLDFYERSLYDMDKIAYDLVETPPRQANVALINMFNDSGMHWQYLYETFDSFKNAFNKSLEIILNPRDPVPTISDEENMVPGSSDVSAEDIRQQVFIRDHFTCLCCGKQRKRGTHLYLQADHISLWLWVARQQKQICRRFVRNVIAKKE